MGANDPNFPTATASMAAAEAYLASRLIADRAVAVAALTGSPTATAAQVVDGCIVVSGGAAATLTLPAASAIITQMQAVDPNAAVGSTFRMRILNENSGTLTVTPGANTTITGATGGSIPIPTAGIGNVFEYVVKWATATTVTLTRI